MLGCAVANVQADPVVHQHSVSKLTDIFIEIAVEIEYLFDF